MAVELVHLGSLYHDDVIDEAETRRGVPSVNARWNNIVAILAGDFLLARASSLAASLGADVAALLAATIGELCRGQVLELQHLFDVDRTEEDYESTIEGKTAALFATVVPHRRHGLGGAATPRSTRSRGSGCHLGMCFQVVDDVLDLTADRRGARQARRPGPPRGRLHAAGHLRACATRRRSRDMLGRPLDPERARASARSRSPLANGAVDIALGVARGHAAKASDALEGADGLDPAACAARSGGLVEGHSSTASSCTRPTLRAGVV